MDPGLVPIELVVVGGRGWNTATILAMVKRVKVLLGASTTTYSVLDFYLKIFVHTLADNEVCDSNFRDQILAPDDEPSYSFGRLVRGFDSQRAVGQRKPSAVER